MKLFPWLSKICFFTSMMVMTVFLASFVQAQPAVPSKANVTSITEIESTLTEQAKCWNEKDIPGFMATYWKSEKLTFSSGGKTTRGWQATFDRYQAKYPPEKMGHLTFSGLETNVLNKSAALVLGNWQLDINGQNVGGNFSLVFKKIDGDWKIIHDHTSTLTK